MTWYQTVNLHLYLLLYQNLLLSSDISSTISMQLEWHSHYWRLSLVIIIQWILVGTTVQTTFFQCLLYSSSSHHTLRGVTVRQLAATLQHDDSQTRHLLRPTVKKKLVSMCETKLIIVSCADLNWHILVINKSDLTFFHLYIISPYVSVINHDALFWSEYKTHNNCQLYLSRIKIFQIIRFYRHSGILLRLISGLIKNTIWKNIFPCEKLFLFAT